MFDTKNHHLVGIDISQTGRIVVAMPPRGSLTRERALMFAAWLITTADAATGEPFEAVRLLKRVGDIRASVLEPGSLAGADTGGVYLDSADGLTIRDACTFLTVDKAHGLAAELVALAHPSGDLRSVFDRIAAVHRVVKDGSELDRILKEEGEAVSLKSPVKRIDTGETASDIAESKRTLADDIEDESPTAVERRKALKP
jgi:hypothetical protein